MKDFFISYNSSDPQWAGERGMVAGADRKVRAFRGELS